MSEPHKKTFSKDETQYEELMDGFLVDLTNCCVWEKTKTPFLRADSRWFGVHDAYTNAPYVSDLRMRKQQKGRLATRFYAINAIQEMNQDLTSTPKPTASSSVNYIKFQRCPACRAMYIMSTSFGCHDPQTLQPSWESLYQSKCTKHRRKDPRSFCELSESRYYLIHRRRPFLLPAP